MTDYTFSITFPLLNCAPHPILLIYYYIVILYWYYWKYEKRLAIAYEPFVCLSSSHPTTSPSPWNFIGWWETPSRSPSNALQ